jgi:molybdopterin/thiamine biosynthesis adenylyltransferase
MFAFGCDKTGGTIQETQQPCLEINGMVTSIGSGATDRNNHDVQTFSYTMDLTNNNVTETFIKEVTLVLPKEFEERLISKHLTVPVRKSVSSKSMIQIKGSLDFDAKGLSKEDIMHLNPRIISVNITNEQMISLE